MDILYALLSALFAGLTAVLAKCGIRKTNSDYATALRTGVVLIFAWGMVFLTGAQGGLSLISRRTLFFLILSGLATGASWLCYFRALQLGDVNKVVPIDKSSVVLTILFSIFILGEKSDAGWRLLAAAVIGAGTLLMLERKESSHIAESGHWLPYAAGSAVFAALTSILGKIGIEGVDSNLGTAIRTCVVLVMTWVLLLVKPKTPGRFDTNARELCFIGLSGLATGASWLFYYRALQIGEVSVVAPIDKLSILVSIGFSALFFHEKLSRRAAAGLFLIVAGTLLLALL